MRPDHQAVSEADPAKAVPLVEEQRARRINREIGDVRVSVVIPAKNEARNLPFVLTRLPYDLHEVILVDGHSIDDTVETARRHYPKIHILSQTRPGKGNALKCGFEASTGDIIVMLDADGSADPREIPRFVFALCLGADFAKGTRYAPGGGSKDLTLIRNLGNLGLNTLVNHFYRTRFSDLCYGYNAFWRDCLPFMNLDCDGFEVETLIHIRLARAGLEVHEVPSLEHRRRHGDSNLRLVHDGIRVAGVIVRELFNGTNARASSHGSNGHDHFWDDVERRSGADRRAPGGIGREPYSGPERRSHTRRRACDCSVTESRLRRIPRHEPLGS